MHVGLIFDLYILVYVLIWPVTWIYWFDQWPIFLLCAVDLTSDLYSSLCSVDLTPDLNQLLTGCEDSSLRLWSLTPDKLQSESRPINTSQIHVSGDYGEDINKKNKWVRREISTRINLGRNIKIFFQFVARHLILQIEGRFYYPIIFLNISLKW